MPSLSTVEKVPVNVPAKRSRRSQAPVFVLGCGRSGTKLLYHSLLSAGGFAVYHAESNAFNLLGTRFGNLSNRENREKLLKLWLNSKLFERSGLTREEIEPRILNQCRNTGDFLRILMETIAEKQGVGRWAEATPLHALYLPEIKKLIPDAIVIQILRDGRDVALSLKKVGWIKPFRWDRNRSLVTSGLFWKWIVSKGRKYGKAMGTDYKEFHYEDLVTRPRETFAEISKFIDQELDYDQIQNVGLGSVHNPNSSFKGDKNSEISPVGRWKALISPAELAQLESAIADLLVETGCEVSTPPQYLRRTPAVWFMCLLYPIFWDVKLWLKTRTPLARIADLQRMGIAQPSNS
jgi:hypothetical protein